jgi:hypothetical protein
MCKRAYVALTSAAAQERGFQKQEQNTAELAKQSYELLMSVRQ